MSSMVPFLLAFLLIQITTVQKSECHLKKETVEQMKGFFNKLVPTSITNLFGGRKPDDFGGGETQPGFDYYYSEDDNNNSEKIGSDDDKKEHGTLDFFGRDVVRTVGKAISTVQRKIGFGGSSNSTKGLDCDRGFFTGVLDSFKNKVKAIYPGTKWCGDGDRSRSYDDLGTHASTDACCREHDLCPDSINAGDTKYGLINTGLFTRSHCDCDSEFYRCLKESGTGVSNRIGTTYFTIIGPQCFREDYPVVDCIQQDRGKCVEYANDEDSEKVHQWFDSPKF